MDAIAIQLAEVDIVRRRREALRKELAEYVTIHNAMKVNNLRRRVMTARINRHSSLIEKTFSEVSKLQDMWEKDHPLEIAVDDRPDNTSSRVSSLVDRFKSWGFHPVYNVAWSALFSVSIATAPLVGAH